MQINRGIVFWGVALITAGAVALAIQARALFPPIRHARRGVSGPCCWSSSALPSLHRGRRSARSRQCWPAWWQAAWQDLLVAGVPDGLSLGCGGGPDYESVTADGSFATDGEVELDISCGELQVSTQAGTAWSVVARHGADEEPQGKLPMPIRSESLPRAADS